MLNAPPKLSNDGLLGSIKSWLLGEAKQDTSSVLHSVEHRYHARAKRLKLNVRAGKAWLTIPPRTSETQIKRFLAESEPWLEQQLAKVPVHHPQTTYALDTTRIDIPLLNTTWTIQLANDIKHAFEVSNILYVPAQNSVAHIREHIKQQAKIYLPNRLKLLAESSGLSFTECTVRHATTRWGSCSARKTISLNAALLLLPTPIIDYVLLHELCHTIEMNHSAAFWRQMSRVMPDWQLQRQALKQYKLPAWWTAI